MTTKEIKQSAKAKLKKKYIKCSSTSLIYFIIIFILNYILNYINSSMQNEIIKIIIQALFAIISISLSYSIIANIISLTDDKTKSITKFIDITILNIGKYAKIIINILINILIPLLLFIFSIFYLLGTLWAYINSYNFLCFYQNMLPLACIIICISFIILIYFLIKFIMVPYIYYNHPEIPVSDIAKNSKKIMKGQILNYFILILSFLPWLILSSILIFILNKFVQIEYLMPIAIILYTLVKPYIVISTLIFYENLESET